MKVILKQKEWVCFLKSNEELLYSPWDLIPREMEVNSIEEIVWTGGKLYHLKYCDKVWLAWEDDIEEIF
jgi:hypothetical protein